MVKFQPEISGSTDSYSQGRYGDFCNLIKYSLLSFTTLGEHSFAYVPTTQANEALNERAAWEDTEGEEFQALLCAFFWEKLAAEGLLDYGITQAPFQIPSQLWCANPLPCGTVCGQYLLVFYPESILYSPHYFLERPKFFSGICNRVCIVADK